MDKEKKDNRSAKIYRVTLLGSVVNLLLAVVKAVAGVVGNSGALVADALHSLSDLASDIVVLLFVKLSSKPKDEDHNYGHGKYETLATTIIGLSLLGVGGGILYNSISRLILAIHGAELDRPRLVVLVAAAISIVAKELLYHHTLKVGKKTSSAVVVANAWHHRTDALSSIGTLLGVGCAYFLGEKWRIADPIAAIAIAALILKVAYDLISLGVGELLERSLPKEVEAKILQIVTQDPQVHKPHNLRTRSIGSNIAIELHIRVDGQMSVKASHQITIEIEKRLKAEFGQQTIVGIHVEPWQKKS